MQGAIFLQKFEEIATFEQKSVLNFTESVAVCLMRLYISRLSKNSFLQLFAENFVKNVDTHRRVI